jgi:uncharacterized lipoprotein YajG
MAMLTRAVQIIGLTALVSLSACAFTPHDLQLHPAVQPTDSTIGQNTQLFFRFVDDRDDQTVGHRGASTMGAKVSADNLPQIVEAQLRLALQKKAFQVVGSEGTADAMVIYRLRSFTFNIETGFFSGGRNANATLAVEAHRKGKTYDKVYRSTSETRILFVPTGDEIDGQMNAALSDILAQADKDENLDRFLTAP